MQTKIDFLSAIIKRLLEKKTRLPNVVLFTIIAAFLWTPLIHLTRFLLTPEGFVYTFIQGRDPSGWVWAIESPRQEYLSSIVLERDVNIFLRSDALAQIFVPYGILAKYLHVPSVVMLIFIEMMWNALGAYATYRFFMVFLKKEKIASDALLLAYFSAGISGILLLIYWLWNGISNGIWAASPILSHWAGEHHTFSFEFMEGNQLITVTSLNRPYYMMARFFGLYSLIELSESQLSQYEQDGFARRRKIIYSSFYLFLCTIIHPASALIFCAMIFIWILTRVISSLEKEEIKKNIFYGFAALLGFFVGAFIWKIYQSIPEVRLSTEQYVRQLYNSEIIAIWTATLPMLFICFLILFWKISQRFFLILFIISALTATIGLSEFIIVDYNAKARFLYIGLSVLLFFVCVFAYRSHIARFIRRGIAYETIFLFALWTLVITAISVSPHHDALKVAQMGIIDFGDFNTFIAKALELGKLVYAARFKLGVFIPLAGLCAYLAHEFLSLKHRKYALGFIFAISFPSIGLYLWSFVFTYGAYSGYAPRAHYDAYEFLSSSKGKNVLCNTQTGIYLLNAAKKRPLLGYGEDRMAEKGADAELFFKSDNPNVKKSIIEKYKIDYIFVSNYEEQLGAKKDSLSQQYVKIYDKNGVSIFEAKKE